MTKAVIRFLVAAISTVVAVALGYMAFLAVDVNRRSIQTVKVQMATAEIGENIDAMMFSDDILVLKNRGQSCQILVDNGEKVGGGEAVAVVFDDEASRQKYVQLEELRDTMAIVSKARQTKTDSAALKTLNSRLSDIAGDFTARTGQGDADFQSSKSDMLLAMMSRELCLGNATEINALYDTLKREISDLELETADLQYIDAERSGYFSALADGWEQVISLESLMKFSCDDYLAAVSVGPLTIDTDRVVGKIVCGYTWYLCIVADQETAGNFAVGKSCDIIVAGEERRLETVRKEYSSDGEKIFIILECRVPLTNVLAEREQKVTIITESYEGFKVPAEAIRVEDGVTGVYVLEGTQAIYKPVEILYIGDGYYIVSGSDEDRSQLFTNDQVIIGGKGLYDGKVID